MGWAVAGTTGYDALHRVDGLFIDPVGTAELAYMYREFASPAGDRGGYWAATVRRAAYRVVTHELAAETEHLTRLAVRICAEDPALRDHAPWALHTAVRELLVRVPVYRPYVTAAWALHGRGGGDTAGHGRTGGQSGVLRAAGGDGRRCGAGSGTRAAR